MIGAMLARPWASPPVRSLPCREWRELYAALGLRRGRRDPSLLQPPACASFRPRDAPSWVRAGWATTGTTQHGLRQSENTFRQSAATAGGCPETHSSCQFVARFRAARIRDAINPVGPTRAPELLVARPADRKAAPMSAYVGTAAPGTPWPRRGCRMASRRRACMSPYRASLEDDYGAKCTEFRARPSAIGTTTVVQKAKELGIPGLYFTKPHFRRAQ